MPFCRHRLGAPINGYNSRMPSEPKERRRSEQRKRRVQKSRSYEHDAGRAADESRGPQGGGRGRAGCFPPSRARPTRFVKAIRNGGRLVYIGAGSSGRMAVLDAAECPPTFGTSPKLVQALIAGGRPAVTGAVEGAEDSLANAARDLRAKKLTRRDVLVGITASGTTPPSALVKSCQHVRSSAACGDSRPARRGASVSLRANRARRSPANPRRLPLRR